MGKTLGLIVNPMAGIGGRVGLKGSDGVEIQRRALALGATPEAEGRTIEAMWQLAALRNDLDLVTYPAEMGANAARACEWDPRVIGSIVSGATTAEDTGRAAAEMLDLGVDLLMFAGGDGTARDVCGAVGEALPVLGIPAGVKIHSAAFGATPRSAGELALSFLQGRVGGLLSAEVMDIDEQAFRGGRLAARLHGYLRVPHGRRLLQGAKSASPTGEAAALHGIAAEVVELMQPGWAYVLGPGTTTRAITDRLGLDKTLLGVDLVRDRRLVAADVNEGGLLGLVQAGSTVIVVSPIGGQGHLFGRGNQQISGRVLEQVGPGSILAVATPGKLQSLRGRPLWVDTGIRSLDEALSGHIKVITGYREQVVYQVVC